MRVLSRTLDTALRSLRRNAVRSALTTLGIVIGTTAVIAMMEIGQGSATQLKRMTASMGSNNLQVQSGTASSGGVSFGSGSSLTLTPDDAEAILRECPAVDNLAPIVRARTQVVRGNKNWVPVFIYGTTPSFLKVREWTMADGEPFTERDVRNASKVCLIGQTLARELFAGESPLGQEVRIKNVPFTIIGVLGPKGANTMGMDQDDIVLAPWTTIKTRVAGSSAQTSNQSLESKVDSTQRVNTLNKLYPGGEIPLYPVPSANQVANNPQPMRFTNIDQIWTRARSAEEIPVAIDQITSLLRQRHRMQPGEPDDFNIRDMTESARIMAAQSRLMSALLLVVASISLVVGGVGIMNIMLVSVTERTREIGLRMAIGARGSDILRQFLIEALALCSLGGALGILLGRGSSLMVNWFLQWPVEPSLPAIVIAVAVSVSVGVIFGWYPAWKAARLDPIQALRYE